MMIKEDNITIQNKTYISETRETERKKNITERDGKLIS